MVKTEENPINSDEHGRDNKGRFAKGNQLSIGNKGNQTTKAKLLKQCFLDTVTIDDMKAIATKIVNMAKRGDVSAAKEVFDRCFGKAIQAHEVDMEVRTYTHEECDSIRKMLAVRFFDANKKAS
jgi:hypothetical protein